MPPFVSESQRGYMHVHHPKIAAKWDKITPSGKLPEHVKHAAHKPLRSDVGPDEFNKRVEMRMKMAEGGFKGDSYSGEGETTQRAPKSMVSATGDADNPDLHDQRLK